MKDDLGWLSELGGLHHLLLESRLLELTFSTPSDTTHRQDLGSSLPSRRRRQPRLFTAGLSNHLSA